MNPTYDSISFDLDYCEADVYKISEAIRAKSSILFIGMPGCGKSRLSRFIFEQPGVLARYGMPESLRACRLDCDTIDNDPLAVYLEMLGALQTDLVSPSVDISVLKNQIKTAVNNIDDEFDLVIIFDDFEPKLQQALGEAFFSFLYALRNTRPNLNLSYLFMANLNIDLSRFYKTNRLFDGGVDNSIIWASLFNKKDSYFSIERQWSRLPTPDILNDRPKKEQLKKRIFELGGGHAVLMKRLAHLFAAEIITVKTEPQDLLETYQLTKDCDLIWADLNQPQQQYLSKLATVGSAEADPMTHQVLEKYGLLQGFQFFSPLFHYYVKTKQIGVAYSDIDFNQSKNKIILYTTNGQEYAIPFLGLSATNTRLLCYLFQNQEEICNRDQLAAIGWPNEVMDGVTNKAIDSQIGRIRQWLSNNKILRDIINIKTERGQGFSLHIDL